MEGYTRQILICKVILPSLRFLSGLPTSATNLKNSVHDSDNKSIFFSDIEKMTETRDSLQNTNAMNPYAQIIRIHTRFQRTLSRASPFMKLLFLDQHMLNLIKVK